MRPGLLVRATADGVGVAELVRRESSPDACGRGGVVKLSADPG